MEEIFRLGVTACALFVLFHFQGNTTDQRMFTASLFKWMIMRWSDATFQAGEYSHGWLIPLVSLYAIWRERAKLAAAAKRTDWNAALAVSLGCFVHWVGARAQQPRVSLAALILLLWAIPWLYYGKQVARLLVFPCFYLVFCIPMNFFDVFSFHLRILATRISAAILNGLAIPVVTTGSAIRSLGGQFFIEVADPCSGIRSLLAMTAIATAFAWFSFRQTWKRATIVIVSIPIVVAGNTARVVSIGIVGAVFGEETALRYYHVFSGYVVFAVAVLLLACCGSVLRRMPDRFNTLLCRKEPPTGFA